MTVKLLFLTASILLFINNSVCQTVYKNSSNEHITLLNDSTIKFDFSYPNVECIANFHRHNDYLEIIYEPYTVDVDTLNNQTCSGFYISNADVYLMSNGEISVSDSLIVDYIPFSFESKNIQFEFRQKGQELNPFILKDVTKGCYRLTYKFSNCVFIDLPSLNRIEIRKKGKQLILGDEKYKLVRCNKRKSSLPTR